MQPDAFKFLFGMRNPSTSRNRSSRKKLFADYDNDALLRSAVERESLIVGEARTRLVKLEPEIVEEVSNARQIMTASHASDSLSLRV